MSARPICLHEKADAFAYVEPVYTLEEKELLVFGGKAIDSKEAADSVMQEIEVNVWRVDQNGQKYASKAWLTVHKKIADITKAAFEEIFNGKERFPMKDVGAYAWQRHDVVRPVFTPQLRHGNRYQL